MLENVCIVFLGARVCLLSYLWRDIAIDVGLVCTTRRPWSCGTIWHARDPKTWDFRWGEREDAMVRIPGMGMLCGGMNGWGEL